MRGCNDGRVGGGSIGGLLGATAAQAFVAAVFPMSGRDRRLEACLRSTQRLKRVPLDAVVGDRRAEPPGRRRPEFHAEPALHADPDRLWLKTTWRAPHPMKQV